MKDGVRALGVAESYRGDRSTLAGAVVRASRVVDGFAFADCTVGGLDATDAVVECYDSLDREDVRYLFVAGIAPAWYNVVDLRRVAAATDRPVVSVTFEASDGLAHAIREAFDDGDGETDGDDGDGEIGEDDEDCAGGGAEERLSIYRDQPDRRRLELNDHDVYYRAVGLPDGEARDLLREFTPEGGRPEPLRVARLAARAADAWREGA